MTLSSKVAVLKDGLVQQLDPPRRIYTHPANEFVAGFVGSPQMNLLTLRCEGQQAFLGDFRIALPDFSNPLSSVVMGIRPDDVSLATPEETQTVQGEVFLTEGLGKENLISIRIDGSDTNIRALLPADRAWEGNKVTLALLPEKIHWFDVKSGERLN
ncbi:TOBE domain-containing protein [Lusitaniella coriacea]